MPSVYWNFHVSGKSGAQNNRAPGPHSRGIYTASAEEVEELAKVSGFEVIGWNRDGVTRRKIEVNNAENSERLTKLLQAIYNKYGFKPSQHKVIPEKERENTFGVYRSRIFSAEELQSSQYLIIANVFYDIAKYAVGDSELLEKEIYTIDPNEKICKEIHLGRLNPLRYLSVSKQFKKHLLTQNLKGVKFDPIMHTKEISKLTSHILLPRCKLDIQNGRGEQSSAIDWSDKWEEKFYNDKGCWPPILRYNQSDIEKLGDFDIGLAYEKQGGGKNTSDRFLIISQKFRKALEDYGITEVEYAPVTIIE